jgi:Flp pilus assembly protein TadG
MTKEKLRYRSLARAHRESEAGQALVETAIAIPVLLLLLLGAAELGGIIYAGIEASNAARAAVQYGAMNGGAVTDTQGMLTAAQNDAYNLPSTSPVTFPSPPTAVCSCSNGVGTSTCTPGDCPGAQIEETLTVYTQVTFTAPISLPGLPKTFTLNGFDQEMVLQ